MRAQIEMRAATIVIIGNFNPAIFHPAWLAANHLLRQQEADNAKIEITHPDIAAFSTEWLQFNCTRERLQVRTLQDAYYGPLRDLVLGVLTLLSHTPIRAVGLNGEFHYLAPSEKYWHSIGDRLAPKADWNGLLQQPGMRSLIIEGQRTDVYRGYVNVHIEPSSRVSPGIFVMTNDHYQLGNDRASSAETETARNILTEHWDLSQENARLIAEHIAALGAH